MITLFPILHPPLSPPAPCIRPDVVYAYGDSGRVDGNPPHTENQIRLATKTETRISGNLRECKRNSNSTQNYIKTDFLVLGDIGEARGPGADGYIDSLDVFKGTI